MNSKTWKDPIISENSTVKTVLQNLAVTGFQISLIVDKQNKLVGTITDGDIRRALLKHKGMGVFVTEVMNSSPLIASVSDNKKSILFI